jgi:hypothetical protein
VTSLEALATAQTAADVDIELTDDGSSGDFGLILLVNGGVLNGIAAARASVGKGSLEDDVDGLRRGGQAVAMATVGGAGFAAGFFRLWFGRPFGERRGLAFGLPIGLVEVRTKLAQFALEPFVILPQSLVVLPQLFVVLPQPLVVLEEMLDEGAEVVQFRQNGDRHGNRVAHLDGCHRSHHSLVTTGPPCLLLWESLAHSSRGGANQVPGLNPGKCAHFCLRGQFFFSGL